jgi:ubiquinone/menaquinone biosynthesis C-methylase UbiE
MMPEVRHDEIARFNFLTNLNVHLGTRVFPGTRLAFEKRVTPAYKKAKGRPPATSQEVRDEMRKDPYYQVWAALRRNTMEMRQQAGRSVVYRQLDRLVAKARALNDAKPTLRLKPETKIPRYLAAVDNHCMPGSYYTEVTADDVSGPANYDVGIFVTGAGSMSARGDGGGRAIARFVRERFPDFKPKRIMDLGAGIGGNTLPIAAAFPDAEVIAVDVAGAMLRYGHARAQALGFDKVKFVQAAMEDLDFAPGSFDWIQTTMFWHETSTQAVAQGLAKIHDLLAPGGLTLNVEQPNFTETTPVWEQFTKDWDAWYNNEPFWAKLHTMNVLDAMADAGFSRDKLFEAGTSAEIEPGFYQPWSGSLARHDPEKTNAAPPPTNRGYKGERWYLFGAWK